MQLVVPVNALASSYQFHLQHNPQGNVTWFDQHTPVVRQMPGIFNVSESIEAQRLLNTALKEWLLSRPQLVVWAEKNLPLGFAVFDLPEAHPVRVLPPMGSSG